MDWAALGISAVVIIGVAVAIVVILEPLANRLLIWLMGTGDD